MATSGEEYLEDSQVATSGEEYLEDSQVATSGEEYLEHIKTTQCKMSNLSNLFLKIFREFG